MKRMDIKTGVVYAYITSKYGSQSGTPTVVLDVSTFYMANSGGFIGANKDQPCAKPYIDRNRRWVAGENYGLLAVQPLTVHRGSKKTAAKPAALLKITVEQALAVTGALFQNGKEIPGTGCQVIIANPRYFVGEYADVVEQTEMIAQQRAEDEARLRDEAQARIDVAVKRVEALRALGLPGTIAQPIEQSHRPYSGDYTPPRWSGNTDHVKLTLAQVDALLSLIPEGAHWEDPGVEDDGWTYREGEGKP